MEQIIHGTLVIIAVLLAGPALIALAFTIDVIISCRQISRKK